MSSRDKEVEQQFQSVRGQLLTEGTQQARFWIRVFQLQKEIDHVQSIIREKPERKQASVPAIGEYIVDDKLTFVYALHFTVDELGVKNVIGQVWYASPKNKAEAFRRRDKLADMMLAALLEKQKHEAGEFVDSPFDIKITNLPVKKESDTYDNPSDQNPR